MKNPEQIILEKEFLEYCQEFPGILRAKEQYENISSEEIEKLSQKYEKINNQLPDSDFFKKSDTAKKVLKDLKSGIFYKQILDFSRNQIEKTIETTGSTFDVILYLDEFPTGEFNAAAMKSNKIDNGVIIMVNTGLFEFIGAITHFFANSIQSEDDESIEEGNARVHAIADFWNAYKKYGDSKLSKLLDVQTGAKGIIGSYLETACCDFVIAHEYGHAIAGHLNNDEERFARSKIGDIKIINKDWEEEYEADIEAANIMISLLKDKFDIEDNVLGQLAISAPLLFFALDDLDREIDHKVFNILPDNHPTHPTGSLRSKNYIKHLTNLGFGKAVKLWEDPIQGWVKQIGKEVILELKNASKNFFSDNIMIMREASKLFEKADFSANSHEYCAQIRELCDKVLKNSPDNVDALSKKSSVLNLLKEFDEAIVCCNRILKNDPQHTDALYRIGYAKLCKGNLDEAVNYFKRVLEIDKDHEMTNEIIKTLQKQTK